MDLKHKVSHSTRKAPPVYTVLDNLVTPIAKDVAFRWSPKGVPHLLVELSNKTIYSLCYFKAYHYWKAFYPYGDGGEQVIKVLNTVEDIVGFLKERTDGN